MSESTPAHLYHGTSIRHLDGILKNGIMPRGKLRRHANDKSFSSSPRSVYLAADGFAIKFANDAMRRGDKACVVFEIDTDLIVPWFLHADDDVIAQMLAQRDGLAFDEAVKQAQKTAKNYCGLGSLKASGSCAYDGTIPVRAITRYATIDRETQRWFLIGASDVGTGHVYRFTADGHQKRHKWLFDNVRPEAPEGTPDWAARIFSGGLPDTRDGITIIDRRE